MTDPVDPIKDAERNFLVQFFATLTAFVTDKRILAMLVAAGLAWGGWLTSKAGDIQPPAVGVANDPCYVTGKQVNNQNQQACMAIQCALLASLGLSCHQVVPAPIPVPPTPTVVVDAGPAPAPNAHPFVQPSCRPPTLQGPDPKMLDQYRRSLRPRHKLTEQGFSLGLMAPVVGSVGWLSNDAFCGNQGNLGACEAFTQLDIATTQPRKLSFATQALFDAAAVNAYKWITANDDIPGTYPPDDTGSDSLSGCKWLVKNGYAKSCQVLSGAAAVKVAIQSGPVITGMNWPDNFMQPDRCGNMPMANTPIGGHALAIMQYDAELDQWDLLNHWNQSWGACVGKQCGHFLLSTAQLFGPVLDADFVQPVQ